MIVPVENMVDQVDLTADDVLLPLLECVANSIISLQQSSLPKEKKKITIEVFRGGDEPQQKDMFNKNKTIKSYKITDNGVGFNEKNFNSFKTPFSKTHREKFGCKGFGRFTVLAAFEEIFVKSSYEDEGRFYHRTFRMKNDNEKEIESIDKKEIKQNTNLTIVEINNCNNPIILYSSAISITEIAEAIMNHCLIYYLSGTLPIIEIIDTKNEDEDEKKELVNDLFNALSKEKEREFELKNYKFKLYITRTLKKGNRVNNYLYYCANSRVVGKNGRNLKHINSIFSYPLLIGSNHYCLDIYLVSEYLDSKSYQARNGFKIQRESGGLFSHDNKEITFNEIDDAVSKVLELEYQEVARKAKQISIEKYQNYIRKNPRYHSFLNNKQILDSIPPNLKEDKLEEFLYKISFTARKKVEDKIDDFIKDKDITEDSINEIKNIIKKKTIYDINSLADYMMRRKAIIELFSKFLEADRDGKYKLEADIHNLIFPTGLTRNETDYENHNLWLLDERFINYKFINSDIPIGKISQIKSRNRPDLLLVDNPQMFGNPIGFGDRNDGEVNSMVVFEFKRPGETAHQKRKTDFRWDFSELIDKYFEDFLYNSVKKNYNGKQVVVRETTPKFGYIILDFIPPDLERYNKNKGWKKTPFGTYYKINGDLNLHYEVMTFTNLLDSCRTRHNPFFNRLFT